MKYRDKETGKLVTFYGGFTQSGKALVWSENNEPIALDRYDFRNHFELVKDSK